MGAVRVGSACKGRVVFTGPTLVLLLLLFITGAECWPWGSVRSCPPGEEPVCPKNPTNDTENYFPHPTDCHYYVQCDSNGRPICRRCSPTTYFSPSLSNCVWPLDARCEHNATTRQSSLLPPICVPDRDEGGSEEEGIIYLPEPCEDATDCRYYYRNCSERVQCPPNQHFNKKSKRCENQCIAGCKNPSEIPECRQCPAEGEILNYQCEYYMICTNGIPEQIKCKSNEHFDLATKRCIPGSCCEDKPDPKNCSFYITNCMERVQCPPNQHYSKKNKQCENVCTAGCQSPENILQCRECEFEGEILKHNCESYIMCRNGKAQIFQCGIKEHFDEKAGKCLPGSCCEDEPDSRDCSYYITNCNQRVSCPPNQHFNKNTKQCEDACTAGCQDPLKIPKCRQCQQEGEILNYDCQYYTICRNGKPEQIKCSINEHFDKAVQKCIPGSCCEDKPDPNDCGYYITNCNQRVPCPPNQHYNRQTKKCDNICTAGCQNPLEIPQCRQCPRDGQILNYECQYYTICRNGIPEQVKCKVGEHFDQTASKCISGPCCEDKPDPNDCGFYITNCNQRVPCPQNQHYNRQTKRCENICTAGCQNPLEIPQCRQCPRDGQILSYECQYYTICRNGKPEQVNCNNGERFDQKAGKCVQGSCCEDKPDPNDCGYYITNCNQRVPCPTNQHYNRQTKRCENICTAGCQNPLEIPQCRQCPRDGEIINYDCQHYTVCKNGVPQQVKCGVHEHFEVAAQKCIPGPCCEDKPDPNDCSYYITNCNQRVQCPRSQHFNRQTKRCENVCTAGCQNPSQIPECNRQCQVDGQVLQFECGFYTVCRNGRPETIRCNANQHFDKATQRCVAGPCCEDQPDPNDCGFYITNCNQRVPCPPNQHYNRQTKRCENSCTAGCQNPLDIPQCRQCKEGEILQSDCQYFTICRNGKPEQINCNKNEHFDKNSRRCLPGPCCEDQPDPSDCGYYITNCNQRVPCPPNTHYNKQTKRCEDVCVAGCQNPQDIPRCRQCKEGDILQYDCQYYTICRNGKPEQIKCSANQRFDERAQRCVPGSCCEDKPDPNDCRYYITNCNQRAACPQNQHFNRQTKKCENVCTAGCQNPLEIQECNRCQEGKILQSDCQYYVICRNGIPEQVKCNSNERFDMNAQRCVPGSCCEDKPDPNDCGYYITNCNQRTACPPNQHYNRYKKQCEDKCSAGCVDAALIPGCQGGECQEGKTYEDPCSCDMYYVCQNGKKVLTMCHEGLHYNKTLSHCDAPCGDVCVKLFARKPECCASTKGKPEPQCSATKLPIFLPHPSDSKFFYQCVDGVLYCNRCPPGHRWNIDTDTCDNTCQCP